MGAFAQYSTFKGLADKAFESKNYYEAAYYYKQLAEGKKSSRAKIPFYSSGKTTKEQISAERPYIYYQLAESYRLYQNYPEAEKWYEAVVENWQSDYPLARLWYGVSLRANKNFDLSIKELQQFTSTYKGDKAFSDLAKKEIKNCLFAKKQYQEPAMVQINKMEGVWNADGGDYALVKNAGSYWFTSSRFSGSNKQHLNRIYTASPSPATPTAVNFSGIDGKKSIEYGTPSLNASGTRMYFTEWSQKGNKTILAIYHSDLRNNTWSAPKKLNAQINADGFNALQPFVTSNAKRLFFVSDRPGGVGGYDIWVSSLDDNGDALNAVNLGQTVNTSADEEAPFYDNVTGRLVYSSKGFVGLGGFDFFESFENGGRWSTPINLGYPINSSKDDLYYYPDPDDKNKFYISSDRESDCCMNLFEGRFKQKFIAGLLTDCDTHRALPGVKVSLVDSITKKVLKQSETGQNERYVFEVATGHSYSLVFEKDGYFTKTISVSVRKTVDTLFSHDICLESFEVNKPIIIQNILYDFNMASLRPESRIALDNIVEILNDNPHIKIELSSHTDSVGTDSYNFRLSQQRAQSCVDYIISKGIDKGRVIAKGYGKSKPIAPNSLPNGQDNPEGRQLNRRTAFTVKSK